ncbi:MAG: DUF3786 domain-containing protein [Elusimicrobia bacterium]|nr:DUF3786 domain-containing protein [Elusimicrobiota bacterium]
MGYEAALKKAWECVEESASEELYEVRFLNRVFIIKLNDKSAVDKTDGRKVKDFISILILHYLEKRIKGLPLIAGEWISFKELSGGQSYYSAFHKNAIERLISKFEKNPDILSCLPDGLSCRRVEYGDSGIIIDVFEGVPVMITLWKGDDEFKFNANILFDKNISLIFCTEDVSILSGILVRNIIS